jgi:hypothetical protein
MIGQLVSLAGAAMVLFAYGGHQLGRLPRESLLYLSLNLVGAAVLTVFAVRARQAGLAVMEGAWALISLAALLRLRSARSSSRSS